MSDQTNNMQEQKIFEDKSTGRMVELISNQDDVVRFTAQGGGFVQCMPERSFFDIFTPKTGLDVYRPFRFSIDDDGPEFNGYSNGERWNGWAIPFLTRDMMLSMPVFKFVDNPGLAPNAASDVTYFCWDGDDLLAFDPQEDAPYRISPQQVLTSDGSLSLYDVGLGWCWNFDGWGHTQCVAGFASESPSL